MPKCRTGNERNDVLVQVYAASVNLLDSKLKGGEFKLILPYKLPLVLGHDVAGVIVKVGSKVCKFSTARRTFLDSFLILVATHFPRFIFSCNNIISLPITDLSARA